ncbi:MAG: winged helix-turn-helix transcriptional regulator [Epulopiscium sp.]|nr:winged helix-turn-helix transcriptional regulator [Candidatus Epulonipiscium sp.]
MKFFSPSAELKELKLLEFIEAKPKTSQHEIARVIGSAASMVNVYMDKFEEQGYLVRDYQSLKVVHYNITPEGIKRKNYLSITYYHELLSLYRLAERNIEKFLEKLEEKGYKNILFYGAGEVAETILAIVKDRQDKPLKVLALIDDSKEKINDEVLGYKVISKDQIKDYEHDGIVITSYTFEDEIKKKLEKIDYPKDKVELFFSGMQGV